MPIEDASDAKVLDCGGAYGWVRRLCEFRRGCKVAPRSALAGAACEPVRLGGDSGAPRLHAHALSHNLSRPANPDVASSGANPLEHYLTLASYEGRTVVNERPSFVPATLAASASTGGRGPSLDHAIRLLFAAAQTGKRDEVAAVTDAIERVHREQQPVRRATASGVHQQKKAPAGLWQPTGTLARCQRKVALRPQH